MSLEPNCYDSHDNYKHAGDELVDKDDNHVIIENSAENNNSLDYQNDHRCLTAYNFSQSILNKLKILEELMNRFFGTS